MATPQTRLTVSKRMFRQLLRILIGYRNQPVTPAALDTIARQTLGPVLVARTAYRGFAVDNYLSVAPRPIETPPLRDYGIPQWRTALDKVAGLAEDGTYVHQSVDETFMERTLKRADLHARTAERNQTIAFAVNDDDVAGWARIDRTPPTCPLCRITISRGPVYTSAQAAGGEGNDYHVGCTCEVVLVMKGQENSWPGIEYFRVEEERYKAATKGAGRNYVKAYRKAVAEENARYEGTVAKAVKSAVKNREEP